MPAGSIDYYVQIGKVAGVGGIALLVFAQIIKQAIPSWRDLPKRERFVLSRQINVVAFLALVAGLVTYIIVTGRGAVSIEEQLQNKSVAGLETELRSTNYPLSMVVQELANRKTGEEKLQAEEVLARAVQDKRLSQIFKEALKCLAPRLSLASDNGPVANALAQVYAIFPLRSDERQLVDEEFDRVWQTDSGAFEQTLCDRRTGRVLAEYLAGYVGKRWRQDPESADGRAARQVLENSVNSLSASSCVKDACRAQLDTPPSP